MIFKVENDWPKHRSGIRPEFPKMPAAYPLIVKWNALQILVMIRGKQTNDLWKLKRPQKELSRIDREIKLKVDVLENPPELFPQLKHPAGCSLQYLLMICEILGGSQSDWYEQYLNRLDEADIRTNFSKDKIESLIGKYGRNTSKSNYYRRYNSGNTSC